MAARRSNAAPTSLKPFLYPVAIAGVAAGAWWGYPGGAALLAAVLIFAWTEPAPELTGPAKTGTRQKTPADETERRKLDSYQAAQQMKIHPLGPGLLPGWPFQGSWLLGLALAAVMACLPAMEWWYRPVSAAGAFMAVAGMASALRAVSGSPGMGHDTLLRMLSKRSNVAGLIGGFVGGGVAGFGVALVLVNVLRRSPSGGLGSFGWWFVAAFAVLFAGGLGGLAWRKEALLAWRELCQERADWEPRWQTLKIDPAPTCDETRMVGEARLTQFTATGGRNSDAFFALTDKITPIIGAGVTVAVLPVPSESSSGPMPGTVHLTKFEVVCWPDEAWPDLGDPSVDPEIVELAARVALVLGPTSQGMPFVVPLSVEQIQSEESDRALYAVELAWPKGGAARNTRMSTSGTAFTAGLLGQVLLDSKDSRFPDGVLFCGDLGAEIDDKLSAQLDRIIVEDEWTTAWMASLGTKVNPPAMQPAQNLTQQLAGGTTIERWVFAALLGFSPTTYLTPGIEKNLASATSKSGNRTMFLTCSGWTTGTGARAGERDPQAFVVYRSGGRVPPSAETLAPVQRSQGPAWVLVGHINHAFDSIRQARPEIATTQCLTAPDSRGHIWEVRLRLHGGVSFGDVRTFAERLRQAMGVSWLRVADAEDGCVLFMGAQPAKVKLARPPRDRERLARLDWEQAWVDAKVWGAGSRVPQLLTADVLPHNDKVEVLDFEMPPGLDIDTIRKAIPKLKTNTGNAYLEVRPAADGANKLRVLTCETDPMPFPAPFDYSTATQVGGTEVAFAVGVDGEPVCFNWKDDPHLLCLGLSGSGKTVAVQVFLTSLMSKPADEVKVFIADPTKGGADFQLMSRYIDGLADTIAEAGALMRALYAEVKRRVIDNVEWEKAKARAAEAGEPSPAPPVRPHLFIVIDEFTGLMLPESVATKPFDDPEMERERLLMVAENKERAEIGALTGRIAREARSADVALMLITQKLKADDLSKVPGGSSLKTNLSRLLLGKATYGDRQSALRSPENAADLGEFVPKGRGLMETTLANGFPVQGWFDSTENLQRFLAGRREPVAEPYLDIAPFRRKPDPSMAGPAIVAVDRSSFAPESDEVIDLGEVEIGLELDDLEMDLDLTDDPAPEVVLVDAVPDPGDAGNTWTFDWEPAPGTVPIEVADPEPVAVAAAEPEPDPIWDVADLWLQEAPPAEPETEPRFVSDEF